MSDKTKTAPAVGQVSAPAKKFAGAISWIDSLACWRAIDAHGRILGVTGDLEGLIKQYPSFTVCKKRG